MQILSRSWYICLGNVVLCHVCGDVICSHGSGAEMSISVGESMPEIVIV